MHIAAAHAYLGVVAGQVLGHALGERGHQHAFVFFCPVTNLGQQIVDLPLHRSNFHLRINQAGGPDYLLNHNARRSSQFIRPRRRGNVNRLVNAILELLKCERPVIHGRGKPESVVHKVLFAAAVPVPHAVYLGNGGVALVNKQQVVAREVVEQRRRGLARQPS